MASSPAIDNSDVATIKIKWSTERFHRYLRKYGVPNDVDPEYPAGGKTALDAPDGKITLYADYFSECNFRVPITHFVIKLLQFYGVHISQVHPMGLCRVRHFEFSCISQQREPEVLVFNQFYRMKRKDSWFSFHKRSGILPQSAECPSSFRDWKERFFYVSARVIPGEMKLRSLKAPVMDNPPENVESFKQSEIFRILTARPADIQPLPDHALVSVGMSRNWADLSIIPLYLQGPDRKCALPCLSVFVSLLFCLYDLLCCANCRVLSYAAVASCYDVLFPEAREKLETVCIPVGAGLNVFQTFHDRFFFPRASLTEGVDLETGECTYPSAFFLLCMCFDPGLDSFRLCVTRRLGRNSGRC